MNVAVGAAAMTTAVAGGCVLLAALYACVALDWRTAGRITLVLWPVAIGVLAHFRARRLGETSLGSSVQAAALATLLAFALLLAAPLEELAKEETEGALAVGALGGLLALFAPWAAPIGCSFMLLPFLVHVVLGSSAGVLAWSVDRSVRGRAGESRQLG